MKAWLVVVLVCLLGISEVRAATFTVNKTADTNDGTCDVDCSLREAVIAANNNGVPDTITIPAGIYNLTFGVSGDDLAAGGDLDILEAVTINGAGKTLTVIDGTANDRVFEIMIGVIAQISDVAVRNGMGGIGGGIRNLGNLTLTDVSVTNNSGTSGGGIFMENASASMTLLRVDISNNDAGSGAGVFIKSSLPSVFTDVIIDNNTGASNGGGVFLESNTLTYNGGAVSNHTVTGKGAGLYLKGSTAILTELTIDKNTSSAEGGGIYNETTDTTIYLSQFSTNQASTGAAIYVKDGPVHIENTTISGNTSGSVGGVHTSGGTTVLLNSTIVNNTVRGIRDEGADIQLTNTIVANNTIDCQGGVTPIAGNLESDGSCGFAINANPMLGPLQNNGGPTLTHALLAGSPAIDSGTNTGCPGTDQRGVTRPLDGDGDLVSVCDVGAIEAGPLPGSIAGTIFVDTVGDGLADGPPGGGNNPFAVGVSVYIYADVGGSPNMPDAGDTVLNGGAPVASDASGDYILDGLADGKYWVVIDSKTLSGNTNAWAEQSYGPIGAWCADGTGGTTQGIVAAGACYGGRRVDPVPANPSSDNLGTWYSGAEHVGEITVAAGGDVTNVDFGFSFNVVATTRGGDATDDDGANPRSVQGSLRQFIQNGDAIAGANVMRLVPAEPTNATDGSGNNWWRINVTDLLPVIGTSGTTLDGLAYSFNNGVTVVNSNNANIGAGETVGVDGLFTTPILDPELELEISGLDYGIQTDAASMTIRNISVWKSNVHDLRIGDGIGPDFTGTLIELNVVGTPPHRFDASFTPTGNDIIEIFNDADSGTVQNNLIGFANGGGVSPNETSTPWLIFQNEIRGTGRAVGWGPSQDAIGDGAPGIIIRGNLVADNAGGGVESNLMPGGFMIEQNTFRNNGAVPPETFSVRLMGNIGSTVYRNIFDANNGPAIIVVSDLASEPYPASEANLISQNRFSSDNASISIDLLDAASPEIEHDNGDGITLNDGTTVANDGNDGLDFPVVDTVYFGTNLTVAGFSRPGVTIEFYKAVGAANDQNTGGTAHGEGAEYLFSATEGSGADTDATSGSYASPDYGSDAAAARFSFTVAVPSGLSLGDFVSAIAIDGSNNTSEFGPNFVAMPAGMVSGKVFDDIAGDGLPGAQAIGDVANPVSGTVAVLLYDDTGGTAGQPDATDVAIASTATAVDGTYGFSGLVDGAYWVVVNSKTMSADNNLWAEQTYGPLGGWCADGSGGTTQGIGTAGVCFGGRRVDSVPANPSSDDLTTWYSGAEHLARITVGGGAVTAVDFGFSFNVVTTTRGGDTTDDDGANPRNVQGSLRQFIDNANTIGGSNLMRFVPAEPANASSGGHSWWRIPVTSAFAQIAGAVTILDGAAFSFTDGTTPINTNTAAIGSGAVVGVSGTYNTPQLDPELELRGDTVVTYGVYFQATADGSAVRNLAFNAFSTYSIGIIGALPNDLANFIVENNVMGTSPASFSDNPAISTGRGMFARDLSNAIIRNNLVGWVGWGLQIQFDTFDSLIETNEIRGIDTHGLYLAGVAGTGQQPARNIVRGNLIESSGSQAINTFDAQSEITITQNTLRLTSGHAVSVYGTQNTVTGNVVTDNTGTGLLLVSSAAQVHISQNQFGNNGQLAIDLVSSGTNPDGPTLNDNLDPDTGANTLLNFPVIEMAYIAGPDLVVSGFAPAGASIELYLRDADPGLFGEGATYLATQLEGSGADLDSGTGSYGPGPVNGVVQGSEASANRFRFRLTISGLPAPVILGDELTATATVGAGLTRMTSEFSGAGAVATDLIIAKRAFFPDGTPISTGETLPQGVEFKYLLYINNRDVARNDITVRDVLDPSFAYLPGTLLSDNTVVSCAAGVCTPAEEAAIFAAVNAGTSGSDAVDADTVSYTGTTIDAGNEVTGNAPLNIATNRVWAILFSVKIQ